MDSRGNLVSYLLLLALVLFVFYRGILPGVRQVDSDFPNYYTAAKIVVDGKDIDKLYDDSWFQGRIRSYGMQSQGKFSPFPPATALVALPLSFFDPLMALQISVAINIGLLVLSMIILAHLLSLSYVESAVFTLLAGIGLANGLRLGQLYILLSCMTILGYYAYTRGKPVLGGVSLGLLVPIKYFPILFIVYFLIRREWRLALAGMSAAFAVSLLGLVVLGWGIHREFLSSVVVDHFMSRYSQQNPFSSEFQSWDSLLRRLFVYDPTLNPNPLFSAGNLFLPAKLFVILLLATFGLRSIVIVHRLQKRNVEWFAIGVLGILGLLLAPGTATYHFVLLWLPLALLLKYYFVEGEKRAVVSLLGLYSLLGFIPYSFTKQFEGRGILAFLAFPRLFILLAMLVVTVYFVWNKATPASVNQ